MSQELPIKYTVNKGKEGEDSGSAVLNAPTDLQEAVQMYGDNAVFTRFMASLKIDAQSICRATFEKTIKASPTIGSDAINEAVQTALSSWTPGVKRDTGNVGGPSTKAVMAQIKEKLKGMTQAERVEKLRELGIEL